MSEEGHSGEIVYDVVKGKGVYNRDRVKCFDLATPTFTATSTASIQYVAARLVITLQTTHCLNCLAV